MAEFIAVKSPFIGSTYRTLKRDALIFSRIAIPLNPLLYKYGRERKGILSEIERYIFQEQLWLYEKGIVFDCPLTVFDFGLLSREQYAQDFGEIGRLVANKPDDTDQLVRHPDFLEFSVRQTSLRLRVYENMDAYPILNSSMHSIQKKDLEKSDVVEIVINSLPVPDDSVSWEQILDYRSDPDSHSKFLALRNWMNDVARAKLPASEVEEKLEYLIDQYQQHMKLHKMKTNAGTLETVIVTSAEFLEDLFRLKLGKIARGAFSFKHRKIALLEGELTAPGNEIAYIVKARERFF